jgi:two-component system, NarL family, invasion response regulator UvrY
MIRLLLVDDHPIVRRGISAVLQSAPDCAVIGEASDGEEVLPKAREGKPDLILLDLSLPGKGGLEVLKQLHIEMPHAKVLILSTFSEKQYAVRCLKAGAHGYLTKRSAPEELLIAIRTVAQGRKYVSASIAELLVETVGASTGWSPHEELTEREFQILCLLGEGKTVSQIARLLSLGLSTISTHRSHILGKMKLETTAQVIRYAVDNDLVDRKS